MTPWVRIGGPTGVPLDAIVPAITDLEVTHEWPDGGTALTLTMLLAPGVRPVQIVEHARCDLMIGARPVWPGYISELDWETGTLTARGAVTEGETTPVLDAAGLTTSIPDAAIDSAISRGEVTWTRPASISNVAYGAAGETADNNRLNSLLAAYQTEADRRIYVDPRRALRIADDPTTPTYYLLPGAPELSWSTQAQATRLIGRYQANAAGSLANRTVTADGATAPYIVELVDLTKRGLLTAARADAILAGILADAANGSWAGGIIVGAHHFAGDVDLGQVAEDCGQGALIRHLGQRETRPGRVPVGYLDVIIGQTVWRPTENTITLAPIGTVARDIPSLIATAQEAS